MQGSRGIAIETRRPGVLFLGTLAAVVLVDQWVKTVVRGALRPAESIPVIDGFFHITHVRNTGAAFGLMPGQRSLFILTSLLVLVAIALYWWRARPRSFVLALSLGLVSGGAIGNLIDRVVAGRVTDFFDFRVFPVFNVADMGIVVGAVGLFAWALFAPIEPHQQVEAEPEGGEGDLENPASLQTQAPVRDPGTDGDAR
ncbi:MAG: signal peptidase II [Anaerosomatales bacterium]|nr:signal peptidase II [Anaerosomatales bacterium]MDT8433269.1 signal peptidase II [Anaerosomatales bacterium]